MKDAKAKQSLIKYLQNSEHERLWQAIRNWSKHNFIYISKERVTHPELTDTFYLEVDKENAI